MSDISNKSLKLEKDLQNKIVLDNNDDDDD